MAAPPDAIVDPVHRVRYTFEPEGENVTVETWIEPGGGLPPHWHPRQEERWSVVEGEARLRLGREKRVIGPADGEVVVSPGTVHGFDSTGELAHLRCHVIPALGLEEFLTESAAAAREGKFMKGGIPKSLDGARWAATFLKRHRADVVMTFPPQFAQKAMIALLAR